VAFRCNICLGRNESSPPKGTPRDTPGCEHCGSSIRLRALIHALGLELFGSPLGFPDFPVLKSIRALGISDDRDCAALLAAKFDYRNTFYHQEPRFDVAHPAHAEEGLYDFVLASEIFEHVAPPVEAALVNVRRLLKPGGFLALTVPYSTDAATREHYPKLNDYRIVDAGGHLALVNRTRAGEWEVFDAPVFHGGDGSTVELRLFSERDLRENLLAAGFRRVLFAGEDYPPFGIVHEGAWGLPVIAGTEPYRLSRESTAEMAARLVTTDYAAHIRDLEAEQARLQELCRELNAHIEKRDAELEEKNRWGHALNDEIQKNRDEIARLQRHEEELRLWGRSETAECDRLRTELKRLQADFEERTEWALKLEQQSDARQQEAHRLTKENDLFRRRLALWEASRWSNLGRALGFGPKLP
jgi:SAM-dependent methyltransferase